ncbi:Uma2 family endonuclease [Streptacidiphilus sp. P02-A3a]|uniref:Uma2 family endonuclease n=1 Tax=Streptacidiphilus sp. P02-A3a TaxID=2704468 RepID=UPI0015FAB7F2|nr:Uma2 family endonuclease [Streptacidiphilus sp. P02-A3a]QMU66986.1 Uma2 family endonuclease [Streptacidiphilus sp. P02-A3a]
MSATVPGPSGFDLPEFMNWDELAELPEEIARDIELWDGRPVWMRRPAKSHQRFMVRVRNAMEASARVAMGAAGAPCAKHCWEVDVETNVFFTADQSSFLTPDFLICRCRPLDEYTRAEDVVLIGEVLSRSDTPSRRDWKMERYARAGIPWYWEVELSPDKTAVAAVLAYGRVTRSMADPAATVRPLRSVSYALVDIWRPADGDIVFPHPFDIRIAWDDLAP